MSLFPKISLLEVPVGDEDEIVELNLEDEDAPETQDCIDLLKAEKAKLSLWLQLAIFYFRKAKLPDFQMVLEQAETLMEEVNIAEDHKAMKLRVLTTLAGFYMKKSRETANAEEKKAWLAKASKALAHADRVSMTDEANLVGKGFLYIAQSEMNNAMKMFDYQLKSTGGERHIPALLGKACVLFNIGKFDESLAVYRKVLKMHPTCPASVRVGIGMCFDRLKQPAMAMAAFQRALQLDAKCVSAMVGQAILLLNAGDDISKKEASTLLRKAYGLSKSDSMVLNHLSDLLFISQVLPPKNVKAQEEKVLLLAHHSLKQTNVEAIRAESHYQLARALHFQDNFEEAQRHYYQATKLAPSFILPHYGLGQMYIIRAERQKAIEMFEKVHMKFPDNYETLKILGSLYGQSDNKGKREKAAQHLKRVSELKPQDIDNWIELAMLLESVDQVGAIEAYTKASKRLEKHGFQVPPEILNNLGCLHFNVSRKAAKAADRAAALAESKSCYNTALTALTPDAALDDAAYAETLAGIAVTVRYNIARVTEASQHSTSSPRLLTVKTQSTGEGGTLPLEPGAVLELVSATANASGTYDVRVRSGPDGEGEIGEEGARAPKPTGTVKAMDVEPASASATQMYEDLLEEHPNYTHCHLRLASMQAAKGQYGKAEELVKTALGANQKDAEVWTAWGNIYMNKTRADLNTAQKKFETIIKENRGPEHQSYAALQLGNIWLAAANGAPNEAKRLQYLGRAADSFKSVLKKDDRNLYAANGIGCVFAQQGRLAEAKDVFISVREAAPTMPEPWINLAHIYLEQKSYDNAIQLYGNCLKKHYDDNDVQLMQFQARACFKASKFAECRQVLLKAMHIAPADEVVRYNTGVATMKLAEQILRSADSTLDGVEGAMTHLRSARLIFQYLGFAKPKKISEEIIKKNQKTCNDFLAQAKGRSEEAERRADQKQKARLKVNKVKMQFEQDLEVKKQRAVEEAVEVEKLRLERLQKFDTEAQAVDMLTIEVKRKAAGPRRPRKPKTTADGDILSEEEGENGAGPAEDRDGAPKKPKAKRKPKGEKKKPAQKRQKLARGDDDDSDSDEDGDAPAKPKVKPKKINPKVKSKEFISESEDEDEPMAAAEPDAAEANGDGNGNGAIAPVTVTDTMGADSE